MYNYQDKSVTEIVYGEPTTIHATVRAVANTQPIRIQTIAWKLVSQNILKFKKKFKYLG
jgi:hypothetical protein